MNVAQALELTFKMSLSVAALSGALGLLAAWLITRTELPGRRVLSSLLSIPYAIPAYLLGMAWVVLGNPTVGLLKDWLPETGAYGFWGIVWVETTVAFAFPFMELKAGFEKLDPSLEEAARMSGAGPFRVFKDVSFPLLWPSLINGMCLSFLYALASFGVPAILGLPVRQFVLTTLIYSQLKLGGLNGLYLGLKLSLLLLALALVALGASYLLTRIQRKRIVAGSSKTARPSLVKLGAARFPASAALWIFFVIAVVLPWIALGLSALAPTAGKFSPSLWTLEHLLYVLKLRDFHEGLINSLWLSALTATGIAAFGFILAFFSVRRKSKIAQLLIEFMGIPFATPGTVIAIGMILLSGWISRAGIGLDSALLLMMVAYSLKYSAVGARLLVSGFYQVHPSLEEAARISGAKTAQLLLTIWLPILKGSLIAAWLLAALPIFTELTMSVLLTGPGAATLGTVLFQLQEYADQPSAAALAWLLLTIAMGIGILTRKKESDA